MKEQQFILYKIYYGKTLVYLGRTMQSLNSRLRGHFFKTPMQREIDIFSVTRIEYAMFATQADMNVYEVYLINKEKPCLNNDDKARDSLTFEIPHVPFEAYECKLLEKWKEKIREKDSERDRKRRMKIETDMKLREMRRQRANGEITEDEYYSFKEQCGL